MDHRSAAGALTTLSCLLLFVDANAAGQPAAGFDLARTSFSAVRPYVASDAASGQPAPLPDIDMPDSQRAIFEMMLQRSETFRRQCRRIASERHLTVRIRFAQPQRRAFRATTELKRDAAGHLWATIDIVQTHDTPEVFAHEIEHIIEQLDGVDLAARARSADSGVRELSGSGTFETTRATLVGRRVAAETRR